MPPSGLPPGLTGSLGGLPGSGMPPSFGGPPMGGPSMGSSMGGGGEAQQQQGVQMQVLKPVDVWSVLEKSLSSKNKSRHGSKN
jgi:hypothetical protein